MVFLYVVSSRKRHRTSKASNVLYYIDLLHAYTNPKRMHMHDDTEHQVTNTLNCVFITHARVHALSAALFDVLKVYQALR